MKQDNRIGIWHALGKVMISPSATFTRLTAHPRTWGPMLCQACIALVFFLPFYDPYKQFVQILLTKTVPEATLEITSVDLLTSSTMMSTLATQPFIVFLVPLIYACVLKMVNFVIGQEAKFTKIWTITIFAYVPLLLETLVNNLLLLIASTDNIIFTMTAKTSLAVFLPHTVSPWVFGFCVGISLFSIWNIVLMSLGISRLFKVKFVKMAGILFGLWLIYISFMAFISQGSISQLLS